MKAKTSSLPKLAINEKAAETDQPEEYITLYRGTTFTRAQEYVSETDISKKSKLILTSNPGQFHTYGATAAYLTRDRELAEYYANQPLKWSPPEHGAILVFKLPARCFSGAWIWEGACDLWNEWVHGNRHRRSLYDDQCHQAKIVEGPVAKSHGRNPKQERPVPQVARDGSTVLTQVCIKCPKVLGILASNTVEVEEVKSPFTINSTYTSLVPYRVGGQIYGANEDFLA